jgi:hypothetical protein
MWFAYIHCWAMDVFSVLWSDPSLYNEKPTIIDISEFTRVEAGSNTSIVTLRVVGGDEKSQI